MEVLYKKGDVLYVDYQGIPTPLIPIYDPTVSKEETMKWTTDTPTQRGYYFVYCGKTRDTAVYCVQVGVDEKGKVSFYFPVSGWEYEYDIEPNYVSHWYGPIEEPAPPVMLEHTDNAVIPQS